MRKDRDIFILVVLVLFVSWIQAEDDNDIIIQVNFFQGTWIQDQPRLEKTKILSPVSYPELAALKGLVAGSENDLNAAFSDVLLEKMDLVEVHHLFSFQKTWNGKVVVLSESIMLRPAAAFRFMFAPKRLSSQTVSLESLVYFKEIEVPLQTGEDPDNLLRKELKELLSPSGFKERMNKIFDKELVLVIGDPVIIGVLNEGRTFFMMITLAKGSPASEQEVLVQTKTISYEYIQAKLKPILQVPPVYPEELRQKGVEGELKLWIMVDKDGIVQDVDVAKSLHPYLDYTASQALWNWRFEPGLHMERTVPTAFIFTFGFKPEIWPCFEKTIVKEEAPQDLKSLSNEKLRRILEKSAEYCQKLDSTALKFICEEKIKEIHYTFDPKLDEKKRNRFLRTISQIKSNSRLSNKIGIVGIRLWNPWPTKQNRYVCDYQLIKKGDQISQRWFIIKENGRKLTDQKKLFEEKRFSILMPLFAAIKLLKQDNQPLFNYKILKEENLKGKRAWVIETIPRHGNEGGVEYAKIWVDHMSFKILKTEIKGIPLEGYEDILKEVTLMNIKPEFKTTHYYDAEKNGVLFPSHSKVYVAYPGLSARGAKLLRLKLDITFDKFKYLTGEKK